MLEFDPSDPFPLLDENKTSYAEERQHSAKTDQWLGLRIAEVEVGLTRSAVPEGQELWIGLDVNALQTPYSEFRRMLHLLSPARGSRIVDFGAGYGRMGFVIGKHHPECSFIGYEIVLPRLEEGNRCISLAGYSQSRLEHADLFASGFVPPEANAYFIYDFGSREAISKILSKLRDIAVRRSITVVGRGRSSRDAIEREHPWLSQVIQPRHLRNFSIYRSS